MQYQDRHPRTDVRTIGIAVELDEDTTPVGSAFRIWLMNLSSVGARIMSLREIKSPRILTQFTLQQFDNQIRVCDLVHGGSERHKFGKAVRSFYTYGICFQRVLLEEDVSPEIRQLFSTGIADTPSLHS